jgi:hypothetical protein
VKKFLVILGFLALAVSPVLQGQDKAGHADDAGHVVKRPDTIKWGPAPPSLPAGAQAAVLFGDPGKSGTPYVIRLKLPDGFKVPAHWHPTEENVTVLKGTFLIGTGDKLDPAHLEEMPAGSYMRMPKTMRHFAMAKGETIVQVHGIGPFVINYVNPSDDPRKKDVEK